MTMAREHPQYKLVMSFAGVEMHIKCKHDAAKEFHIAPEHVVAQCSTPSRHAAQTATLQACRVAFRAMLLERVVNLAGRHDGVCVLHRKTQLCTPRVLYVVRGRTLPPYKPCRVALSAMMRVCVIYMAIQAKSHMKCIKMYKFVAYVTFLCQWADAATLQAL